MPKSKYKKIRISPTEVRDEHRLVMEAKLGRSLESWELVHHVDEDKSNNHPDNLELTTRPEHGRLHHPPGRKLSPETVEKIREARLGEKSTFSVLTESQVRTIRQRMAEGAIPYRLAREYGVSKSAMQHIKHRRSWPHVS